MSIFEFFSTAFEIAKDTVLYLFAYGMVPVFALAAMIFLRWVFEHKKIGLNISRAGWGTTFFLAIGSMPGQKEMVRALRQLEGRPNLTLLYLVCSHNLLLYYFFFIGPLLGKDVLFSHLIATAVFLFFSLLGARIFRFSPTFRATFTEKGVEIRRPLRREMAYFVGWAVYGLFWGGVLGAWGLSSYSFAPVEIADNPVISQLANAVLGGTAAVLTNMWPVAVLFAGTYLWKVGLAHAGLAAFFLATTITPQRWLLYRRLYGRAQATQLFSVLSLGLLMAGFMTALLWKLFDLQIRYRLLPQQVWQ